MELDGDDDMRDVRGVGAGVALGCFVLVLIIAFGMVIVFAGYIF